jgi:hypothetical protein
MKPRIIFAHFSVGDCLVFVLAFCVSLELLSSFLVVWVNGFHGFPEFSGVSFGDGVGDFMGYYVF